MISSQAAISLENANLYRNLEIKVKQRTKQLEQKSRDINSMLQNMKQGIFTFYNLALIDRYPTIALTAPAAPIAKV